MSQVLFLYDKNKKLTEHPIANHYNYIFTEEINTLPNISFNIHYTDVAFKEIELEGYLRTDDGFFVIKEINVDDDGNAEVFAVYDTHTLTDLVWKNFKSSAKLTTTVTKWLTNTT